MRLLNIPQGAINICSVVPLPYLRYQCNISQKAYELMIEIL